MEELLHAYKKTGTVHHAHILIGDPSANTQLVLDFSEQVLGKPSPSNPDISIIQQNQLAIEDAQQLRALQSNWPVTGTKRFFVIAVQTITLEAQQALLKILEEPAQHSLFFIALPTLHGILPTLRSRVRIIQGKREELPYLVQAHTFLKSYPKERLTILEPITADLTDDDEEKKKKARRQVDLFLRSLITAFSEKSAELAGPVRQSCIQEFATVQRYMRNVGSAPKLLIEHLALVLPVFG